MIASLSPEYELLLDAVLDRVCDVSDSLSWDRTRWELTLRLATWHRLSPVLYSHLAKREQAPPEVLAALEQAYLANCARNLAVSASLRRALEALAAAAIPAMLLKGAALIESVYPDPALREMLDLDILVPADKLDPANDALAAIGFAPAFAVKVGPQERKRLRANHIHDPELVSEDRIAAVELHHHIAIDDERAQFDVADIWQRARPARGGTALLPSPEDLLLHVCFHFTRNRTRGSDGALGQICDIARIVEREDIDWELLISVIRGYGLQTRVYIALSAAGELGVAIAAQVLRALRPPGFDRRIDRRLVDLRVLRAAERFPLRSLRLTIAPARETLVSGWDAGPDPGSLARAYLHRVAVRLPHHLRSALNEPRSALEDYLLNGRIHAVERRERAAPGRWPALKPRPEAARRGPCP